MANDVPSTPGGAHGVSSAPEIVFAGTDGGALTELADYEKVGGLAALAGARSG